MEDVYVLDASALILGCAPPGRHLVPSAVASEVHGAVQRRLVEAGAEIASPSARQLGRVRESARKTGDLAVLSAADLELLAVALDELEAGRRPTVVSDDYAVQNVAAALGLAVLTVGRAGIRERRRWRWYCAACSQSLEGLGDGRPCPRCGAEGRRRRRA